MFIRSNAFRLIAGVAAVLLMTVAITRCASKDELVLLPVDSKALVVDESALGGVPPTSDASVIVEIPQEPATTVVVTTSTVAPAAARVQAGIPAYFEPAPLWNTMVDGQPMAPTKIGLAVMNPASGPGQYASADYVTAIGRARSSGIRVFGYVATGYGRNSNVFEDIATYRNLYGVTDIFLDESATDCISLDVAYRPWIDTIRQHGGLVAVNPGITPQECWASATDVIVNFEGLYSTYVGTVFPSWTKSYPVDRFWHIVYAVPSGLSSSVIERAAAEGAGYFYATADGLQNPYDTLPAEFSMLPPAVNVAPSVVVPPVLNVVPSDAFPPVVSSVPSISRL